MNHAETGTSKARSYNGDYMDIGKQGEEIVIAWLEKRPEILDITDFRDIRAVHEADVDVGLRLYKGPVCLVEIKTDTHLGKSPNVLTEVLRINHYANSKYAGYLGWSLRSPAEHLLFYAPNRKPPAIYRTTFARYRGVLQLYSKTEEVTFTTVRTDETKTTYNILIPMVEYEGIFTVYEL